MKKNNVLIITFISILIFVFVATIMFAAVFVVRDISVESDVVSNVVDETAIIESSKISNGKSIISLDVLKHKMNIESANPYVKVKSINRTFPNKVVIKVSKREQLISVRIDETDNVAILDDELKVLGIVPCLSAELTGLTEVSGVGINPNNGSIKVGNFISFGKDVDSIFTGIFAMAFDSKIGLDGSGFRTFFKSVSLSSNGDVVVGVSVKTNTGVSFLLDTSLPLNMPQQLYMCYSLYMSGTIDKSCGFIHYDNSWIWDLTLD